MLVIDVCCVCFIFCHLTASKVTVWNGFCCIYFDVMLIVLLLQVYVYETSAAEMSRPRQCVPLTCVKYIRNRSPAVTVRHTDTLNELRHLAAASASPATQTDSRSTYCVPHTGPTLSCSSSFTVASSSCSTFVSAPYPMTNCEQQSAPLRTVQTAAISQHSHCQATDASVRSSATIGLASAVWSPMGAALQQTPQNGRVDTTAPVCHAELLRRLAFHRRLTVSFNNQFSREMNSVRAVIQQACRAVTSHVFEYTLDRLCVLRFKYCQLSDICAAYCEYQRNARSNRNVMLPSVSCLNASIEIMMNSVNTVAAAFAEMRQWLSTDTRMTVTERGFVLANKLCHYAPVFMQEMNNFKRSLLMIVPEAACTDVPQSMSIANVMPSSVSSVAASSAATVEAVSPVMSQLQDSDSIELYAQDVEPVFIAPMPIVIEPDGQPDDELDLIHVKQEPVEMNRKRRRTHMELICVDDNDTIDAAVASAVDEVDDVVCTTASHQRDGSRFLPVNLSPFEHHNELSVGGSQLRTEPTSSQSPGTSINGANEVVLTEAVGNMSNSVKECISSDISVVQTVVPGVSEAAVMLSCEGTLPCSCVMCMTTQCSTSEVTADSCDKMNDDLRDRSRSSVKNDSHVGGPTVAAAEHSFDWSATRKSGHCSRNLRMNCETSNLLNVAYNESLLSNSGESPCKQSVDAGANSNNNESDPDKMLNAASGECHDSNTVLDHAAHHTSNNLFTISSVCSVDMKGFEFVDMIESTTVDDIVNAVRTFDENANIVFDNVDLCSHSCPQKFELSHSSPVQTNKERVPALRLSSRMKQKYERCIDSSVSDNLMSVQGICENNVDDETNNVHDETLHSEHDVKTVDNPTVTDIPVCSDEERFDNTVVACQDTNAEELLLSGVSDITSKQLDASHYTGCSESIRDTVAPLRPMIENPETGLAENTDSLSETHSESLASVNSKTAVDTSAGSICQEATELESGKQDCDERYAVLEEKCLKQPRSESRDDLLLAVDEDRLNVPAKKKQARVLNEEEDDENVVPAAISVNVRSVQCTTQTSLQGNVNKKVKKFNHNNSKSMNCVLKKNAMLEEKKIKDHQSKKMKKQQQPSLQKQEQNSTVLVDKGVVVEASRACTDPKHDSIAIRKHKLKKSRKLLKRGVKQKSKHYSSHSNEVAANGHVQQRSSCRLPKSDTLDVVTKTKVSSQSNDSTAEASTINIVHSHDNEVQPRLSARDKVNTIFKNSEFTKLHSTTSLRHSDRSKPSIPGCALSSSKVAEVHSKIDAKSVVLPRKNGKISTAGCDHDIPKSVVTSGSLNGTAATSSAVIRRPGKESSSVKVSVAASDASVKMKVLANQSSTASFGQTNQLGTSPLSQRKLCEAEVCSNAASHSVESTVPSLPKVTTSVVSSISHSLTGSQPLNISSSAAVRDPRLTLRQRTVSQQMFGLKDHRNAENLATNAVDVSSCAQNCSGGSVHWPWEQTENTPPAVSTNFGSEQYERNKQLADWSAAGCWVWESGGENSLSSHGSRMSIDVNDILSDLSTSCSAEEYLQNSNKTSEWHSASRVLHGGSLVSPPLHSSSDGHRISDHGAKSVNNRKTEDMYAVKESLSVFELERPSVTVESHTDRTVTSLLEDGSGFEGDSSSAMTLNGIMLPVEAYGSQQYTGSSSIDAQHYTQLGNSHVNVYSDSSAAARADAASDLFSPCNKDPGWRLIPLDLSVILHMYNPSQKPLSERMTCSGPPSDPRLKASGHVINNSSLTCDRDISVSVYWSNETDFQPVVVNWETDLQSDAPLDPRLKSTGGISLGSVVEPRWESHSMSDAPQTELTGELGSLQSETSAADSLDSRIDVFVPQFDAIAVDKKVKDEVEKRMSWWQADLDNAEKCLDNSVCSHELQQHAETIDSDVDDFIIIDDDDDDDDDHDNNDSDDNNELVIDLSSTDVKQEPNTSQSLIHNTTFTKMALGHSIKHDVARNVQEIMAAESKPDHSTLSDQDRQFLAEIKENCHVGNPVGDLQECYLPVNNDSSLFANHQYKSVKHRNGTREHVKHGTTKGHDRTVASESNSGCSTDSFQHAVGRKRARYQVLNNTSVFKPSHDSLTKVSQYDSAAATREMDRNPSEGFGSRSTKNARKVPMSSSMAAKSQCKVLKADSNVSNVDSASLSVSSCLASLADVSTSDLSKLKRHMKAKVKAVEQKATLCKQYACSLDNLDESEKRQLVAEGLAEPAVVNEFAIELRLLSVLREIDKAQADMAKIKSQFDPTCLSISLEKKYDQFERACNNLIVRRDWCYTRMHRLRRYYKSRFLLTLPDDLRFGSERGKCVSIEGVPLILNDPFTISLHHCKRLAALLVLIKRLRSSRLTTLTQDVLQTLGWLHEERKILLNEICCSSPQKIGHCIECLSEKLTMYKYV